MKEEGWEIWASDPGPLPYQGSARLPQKEIISDQAKLISRGCGSTPYRQN